MLQRIKQKAEDSLRKPQSKLLCNVPDAIRTVDKSSYLPRVVSIGPLHHQSYSLRKMKEKKLWHVWNLLFDRFQVPESDTRFDALQKSYLITRARAYYTDEDEQDYYSSTAVLDNHEAAADVHLQKTNSSKIIQSMSDEEFAEMMLIDGCFILETIISFRLDNPPCYLLDRWEVLSIKRDLLLLENQIPCFVLQKLSETIITTIPDYNLDQYIVNFFKSMLLCKPVKKISFNNCLHILDLVHNCMTPSEDNSAKNIEICFIHSATELQKAGVKFIGRTNADHLLDVKFEKFCLSSCRWICHCNITSCCTSTGDHEEGNLPNSYHHPNPKTSTRCCWIWWMCVACRRQRIQIPKLPLTYYSADDTNKLSTTDYSADGVKSLLRNLIAYEQVSNVKHRFFSQYGYIMSKLINDEEDVQILLESGIIDPNLGTAKELCDFFNSICNEVVVDCFHWIQPWNCLDAYYLEDWPRKIASFKSAVTIGAAFLLILTIVRMSTQYCIMTT